MLNFIRGEGAALELNFAFVYTMEAHAADKWPMKWAIEWPEPTSLEERIACAKRCDEDLGWSPEVKVFLDTMDNQFCEQFKAWPAGCYVFSPTRRLHFIGQPESQNIFFDLECLFGFLRKLSSWTCPECNGKAEDTSASARDLKTTPENSTCALCGGDGSLVPKDPVPQSAPLTGA